MIDSLRIKLLINKFVRRFGYQFSKINNQSKNQPDLFAWLNTGFNIKTIIDIGANDGVFGSFLAHYFSAPKIYAFEPIPTCIPLIEKQFSGKHKLKIYNMALSNHSGNDVLYLNDYHPASSLLRVSDISKREFPQTSNESPIEVKVRTLDAMLCEEQFLGDIFIKLDVQGMEDKVIEGGKKIFSIAKFVLIEMSFVPIYENQPLFEDINSLLTDLGFQFAGIKNQINSPKTGQPLFVHCLYCKD
jgi:FkbM family methyltransferase